MIENEGVTKTVENLRINKQTLYKWKNARRDIAATGGTNVTAEKESASKVSKVITEASAFVSECDSSLAEENARLMNEISVLCRENDKLKKTIRAFSAFIID